MSWDLLVVAIGLVFVCEGLMPFLSPATWRRVFQRALELSDGQIRFVGLGSLLLGLVVLMLFLP